MDVFKTQFETIKKQFDALSATQKMLTVALIAVMALTLVYWSTYAGSAETVSLLGGQTLTESELGNIDNILETRGIKHTIVSGKMMVPADHKTEALALLMFDHALPTDTRTAFEEMSKSLTPWASATEREAVYTQALNKQMATVIAGFPGVASATVVISAKSEPRIEDPVPPTAMVSITTKPNAGVPIKKLARAAADGLAGAVADLKPAHVSVIIDGVPNRVPDDENGAAGGDDSVDEKREHWEIACEERVRKQLLPYINGLTITVNADSENRTQTTKETKFSRKDAVVLPTETINRTEKTTNTPVRTGEPGVASNTGANAPTSLAGVGGGGETVMSSETEISQDSVRNNTFVPGSETTTSTPPGKSTATSAAVGVPLSYFKLVFHGLHPAGKDPSDAELTDVIKSETRIIIAKISKAIGIAPTDLAVDMYVDAPPEVMAPAPPTPSAAMGLLTSHGKEIAVGVLAAISLGLMVMMVRKAPSVTTVMTSAGPMSIASLEGGGGPGSPAVVGGSSPNMVATAGSGALDGMELGDDEVRTAQMLEQVTTLVKENPDGAAALVKKWMTRS